MSVNELREKLAEALSGGWDKADAMDAADALLPIVAQEVAAVREQVAKEIEGVGLALVSTDDSEGTALTAAVLGRAASIARGGAS